MTRTAVRATALIAADAIALVALVPDITQIAHRLTRPSAWLRSDVDGALAQLGGAALWCLACWLGVGLLATALSSGRGPLSRSAAAIGRRLFPATVRRLLAGALGLGIALSPTIATAAPTPAPVRHHASEPAPTWPITPPSAGTAQPDPPLWPTTAPTPGAATTPSQGTPTTVTVAPGDSLWLITARHLPSPTPPRIAAEWPRWYAANRAVIGDDPTLIRPGQVLHAPVPTEERS